MRGCERRVCHGCLGRELEGEWQDPYAWYVVLLNFLSLPNFLLADGNAAWAKAAGMDVDLSAYGMGVRSKRFAFVAEDGKVTHIGVDDAGLEKSSAESVLAFLKGN